MLIDWTTVIFQLVNFLILMALLKKFLFGRITRAMDEREERIADRLDEAERKKREAEERAEKYDKKLEQVDEEAKEKLSRAAEEAEERKQKLLDEARKEVQARKERWQKALAEEKESFLRELRERTAGQVYDISRRVLADLADAEVEEKAVDVFLQRLDEADRDQLRELRRSLQESDENVVVSTGFDLAPGLKQKVTRAVHEKLVEDADVEYVRRPRLVMGLEIQSEGYKLAWSAGEYIDELERLSREALLANSNDHQPSSEEAGAE